jgi:uncharacterized membrane protein SpoIIM required for sporulation
VARFLNQLCGRAYATIYQPPRERAAALRAFFLRQLPATARAEGRFIAASAGILVLGTLLGALVVAVEPRGAELLVPPGVRAAVAEHRMWTDALLTALPGSVGASMIATNNLTVTIVAFASGIFFGLGPLFVLASNGMSLGAITALCVREGLGWPLFSFIGAHGPIELSIIAVAGGAGLMLGHALIDPGELPRGQMLRKRGRRAVRLVLGCAPPLVLAGVLEGFVDPGDVFPGPLKIALGIALAALFWGYLLLVGRAAGGADTDSASAF